MKSDGSEKRVVLGDPDFGRPVFSPDGLFVAVRKGTGIYIIEVGKNDPQLIYESTDNIYPGDWIE